MNKVIAVIVAAGSGTRFGTVPKQHFVIQNKSVLEWTIEAFIGIELIDKIIIVASPNDNLIDNYQFDDKVQILKSGGTSRPESVLNALSIINFNDYEFVLVHDAVRCCITKNEINHIIKTVINSHEHVGVIFATPVKDTLKLKDESNAITTVNRNHIYLAQTPQIFNGKILYNSYMKSTDLSKITDESSAVEMFHKNIMIIDGSCNNLKLTYPEDIEYVKYFLSSSQIK